MNDKNLIFNYETFGWKNHIKSFLSPYRLKKVHLQLCSEENFNLISPHEWNKVNFQFQNLNKIESNYKAHFKFRNVGPMKTGAWRIDSLLSLRKHTPEFAWVYLDWSVHAWTDISDNSVHRGAKNAYYR